MPRDRRRSRAGVVSASVLALLFVATAGGCASTHPVAAAAGRVGDLIRRPGTDAETDPGVRVASMDDRLRVPADPRVADATSPEIADRSEPNASQPNVERSEIVTVAHEEPAAPTADEPSGTTASDTDEKPSGFWGRLDWLPGRSADRPAAAASEPLPRTDKLIEKSSAVPPILRGWALPVFGADTPEPTPSPETESLGDF